MTFKPKFIAGILFILVMSVTITVAMVSGVWKIEERHGRGPEGRENGHGRGFMGERNQPSVANASTDPKGMLLIDWCFQNEASPECVAEKLDLDFEDMEKSLEQISVDKGIQTDTLIGIANDCIGSGSDNFQGGKNRENEED